MTLQPLLDASPVIGVHVLAAFAAFGLGAVILFRRKGSGPHRLAGRLWVGLMVMVAGSSFFIHTIRMWGPWSAVHLLSIATLAALAYAVAMARSGNIPAHARVMKASYLGALGLAGVFTLAPGRIMNHVVFGTADASASRVHASTHGPTAMAIVVNTPLWVWPLLLYVLYVGWSRTRDRVVAPRRLLVMPAVIGGLAIYNLVSLDPSPAMLLGFACGLAAGALAGRAVGRRRVAEPLDGGMLRIRGDWMPLLLVVGIFAIRYAHGVVMAIDPSLARDSGFLLAGVTLSGLFAAMMIARAISTLPPGFFRSYRFAG
jgi:uncharacterized membrane protein